MFKLGIAFLFGAFTHLIAIYILGSYLWIEQFKLGGVEGNIASQVPSVLFSIFYAELLISVILIAVGVYGMLKKQ